MHRLPQAVEGIARFPEAMGRGAHAGRGDEETARRGTGIARVMRTENMDRTITTQKEQIDRMVSGAENALKFVLSLKEKDNSKTHGTFCSTIPPLRWNTSTKARGW